MGQPLSYSQTVYRGYGIKDECDQEVEGYLEKADVYIKQVSKEAGGPGFFHDTGRGGI